MLWKMVLTMKTQIIISCIIAVLVMSIKSSAQSDSFGFTNPVIPGFNPDPSVCRVGDDFYLVTSTFEYFPGVPIYHSKDMVNWKQIGYCLTRDSQLPLQKCAASAGIYAPTLRYHNGLFYMVTTNVSGGGNFFVTAKDPAGEWSEPVWVNQGGIDPTIFWDDNGKTYFVSNNHTFDNGTFLDGIVLSEIDLKTGKIKTVPEIIWNGTGGRYPEAPHIYKKDGFYYLLIAEGGTEYGHGVTIARSHSIYGPYDACPYNPILTHTKRVTQSNPIQGTGHADLVQAADGSWWLVCLGFRTFNGQHHTLGRETFLAPVIWPENGWPVVNGNGTINLNMKVKTLPQQGSKPVYIKDDFSSEKMGLEWNYLRNPARNNYSFTEKPGFLTLKATEVGLEEKNSPSFIGRRQQHFDFEATTELDFNPTQNTDEAGITVLMNNTHHYKLVITKEGGKRVLRINNRLGAMKFSTGEPASLKTGSVKLKIVGSKDFYTFYYAQGNDNFKELGRCNSYFLSSETAGGFTGVYIGLFATGNGEKTAAKAYFDWFDYQQITN
jgi:alpha-N-arabinofuranosidase